MSGAIRSSVSRFQANFIALKVRSSQKICEERLACKGVKPFSVFFCKDCNSHQCEACELLLHEHVRLAHHERWPIREILEEELCQANCKDKNIADVECPTCEKKLCYMCDFLVHSQGKQTHNRTKCETSGDEFISCEFNFCSPSDCNDNDNCKSYEDSSQFSVKRQAVGNVCDRNSDESLNELDSISSFLNSEMEQESFLLISDNEQLQIPSAEAFASKLGCEANRLVKVVSIFGNTGDGKSYTLNHTFYNGKEVFKTSSKQVSCTVGVWAAFSSSLNLITIDTEGFLGLANNQNQRARLLLKILAISDIIIYRTRAERLHNDMFKFLGDSSAAYSRHFSQELEEACMRCNIQGPLSLLGPAVIVFHETQHTDILSKDEKQAEEAMRLRFQDLGLRLDAFSSLEYVGIKTEANSTDFDPLKLKIKKHFNDSSVRSPRSPSVVYKVLKVLNDKFCGNIEKTMPSTFPDQYFTCSAHCLSCKCHCTNSMNHMKEGLEHESTTNCVYQHQYVNRIYLCKVCFERGEEIIVSPKTFSSNDSSWIGLAKYAWTGYLLECSRCGIIYRSRQYWYGNKDPWETCVRTKICHVWPQDEMLSQENQNTAQSVVDSINTVSKVVSDLGAKPTRLLSNWVADQIAPSYWIPNSQITHCGLCEKEFDGLEAKHHCRVCGGGFCEACSSKTRPVPQLGWGTSPVRVCDKCYDNENGSDTRHLHHMPEVTVRKVGEAIQMTLGTVVSAVNYPIGLIKDSARPSYWVPDHLLSNCYVCKEEFSTNLTVHHCRACGQGICELCSTARKPVNSRGWNYPVRVCDICNESL